MVTRRTALKVAAAGAVTAYTATVPGLSAWAAPPLRVRRGVNAMKLDDPDLSTYRDFVGLMRSKPATEPVSWVGFANQHGDENDYKYCPHGDWYFLPWHRGFVDMYEKAAMKLMNNPKFAMPYWDWTNLRTLPAAFTNPQYKGKPNPLYVPGRGDPPDKRNQLKGPYALTDALVGPNVIKRIYAETVYEAFGTSRSVDRSVKPPKVQDNLDPKWVPMGGGNQGVLEGTPHNHVHNNIGAFMPNSNSPRDPIFMMHHGNIDRIWAHWNALGRTNSTDPLWLNMPFKDNYIAPDGKFYSWVVKDLQSTAALGYTYDDLPRQADKVVVDPERARNLGVLLNPAAKDGLRRIKQLNTKPAKPTEHLAVPFALGKQTIQAAAVPTALEGKRSKEIVALISDIEIGDNVLSIRVFVNHPKLVQNVPDSDPHFVTTLSFLKPTKGGAHAQHMSKPSAIVDLTETLRKLAGGKKLEGDHVTVQLLPVARPGVAMETVGAVVPASIEIAVI